MHPFSLLTQRSKDYSDIAGAAWDFGGAWPAYAFGFAWGVALTLALLCAPRRKSPRADGASARQHASARTRLQDTAATA
jgi:hypothetical protein